MSLVHPDIDWVEPPDAPDRHVVKGRDAALDALRSWLGTWSDYEVDLREVSEHGDKVIADMHQKATVSGLPVESDLYMVWTFRDAVPVRMDMFLSRDQADAAVA